MATVNAAVVERLGAQTHVIALNAAPRRHRSGLLYHAAKASRALGIMVQIVQARFAGARTYYASVDDGLGGIWTASFAFVARLCGFRIFLHHHSFRYVDKRRRIMALLTAIAGKACCHVVLCEVMAAKLKAQYRAVTRTMVAPNLVQEPPTGVPSGPQHGGEGPITIGLLSNLMFEKGVAEFIAIIEQARAVGLDVQGILAGPAWNAEVEAYIQAAIARNGEALRWIGPVSGDAKERFFAEIEVFVFPTKYPSEAYPLVLVEGLTRGCPFVAPDRGSIGSFRALSSATIIDREIDFVPAAVSHLANWVWGGDRPLARERARAEGAALNAANHAARERLVEALLSG
jgi:glycosyltransferase involved in cell wall biosynthesis